MIKIQPALKDYLWGGEKLKTLFGREKRRHYCRKLGSIRTQRRRKHDFGNK